MHKRVIVGLADALVDVWRRLQLPFTRALAVETSFAKAAIVHPSQGKIVQEVLGPIWIEQRGRKPAPPPRRRAEDAPRKHARCAGFAS
jgi:hypothetical protein